MMIMNSEDTTGAVVGIILGVVFFLILCRALYIYRAQVFAKLDKCAVALVTWCASIQQRAEANAKPQPTAVEIHQAPTFNVVDGQVVQPAGVVQPAAVSVQVDTNGDGVTDTIMTDTDGDGQFDSAVPMGIALK